MRILDLKVANIKRIKVAEVTPDGDVVRITGKNASGKTSLIDSIAWALGGADGIQAEPIRNGEDRGAITVMLGDEPGAPSLKVHREFRRGKPSTLTVSTGDGEARFPSPQKMLDALYSRLTFDPHGFLRMEPAQQLTELRRLVKLDVDVDALDQANRKDYEERTFVNREGKAAISRRDVLMAQWDPTADTAVLDEVALRRELAQASGHNTEVSILRANIASTSRRAHDIEERADRLEAEIAELRARADELDEQKRAWRADAKAMRGGLDGVLVPDLIDVDDLTDRLMTAQQENQRRASLRERGRRIEEARLEVDRLVVKSRELTEAIALRTAEREASIGRAQMPVPGLTFGEGQVLYNGVPFDQSSSAEQLRVSFAIAVALNPKLRIALIRDGSLLDAESLKMLSEMAEQSDTQVWLETVATGDDVGIVLEDGVVKGAGDAADATL